MVISALGKMHGSRRGQLPRRQSNGVNFERAVCRRNEGKGPSVCVGGAAICQGNGLD